MTASVTPRLKIAVRAAVRMGDGLLLIAHHDPHLHYNLPGGSVRPDEPMLDTLNRKCAESLGDGVQIEDLLFVHETLPGGSGSDPSVFHKLEFVMAARVGAAFRLDRASASIEPVALDRLASAPLLPPIQGLLLEALKDAPPAAHRLLAVD
ncbi:NUDIX domain-containing protein [Nonomuraea sp. NPDC050451]|uniref:NUDIX domain-containing protein n=1 Tax=Nonomuraea sp. NPDC050451 TaxID=3364364 RepID=UPI0037AE9994